jgi:hypothetical protein
MSHYIFVANVGDFMLDNVRASYEAAANRWEVDFVEYIGERDHAIEDKFAGIDEFNDDDILMIADADILYRIDCPSPFQFATDFGISAATDVQRVRHYIYDYFGHSTEKGVAHYALQFGLEPCNCLPMNTGVLIGTVANFKKVREPYYRVCAGFNWEISGWHYRAPQTVFPVVCEDIQMPVIKMPDWTNKVNVVKDFGPDHFPKGCSMLDWSFHPAGVPSGFKNFVLEQIDWTIRPEEQWKSNQSNG